MSEKKSKGLDWAKVIMSVLLAGLSFFGIGMFMRANAEEKKRVEAQNQIARMSEVIHEREQVWSRLSVQQDDLLKVLKERNQELADMIEERDESILTLSQTIANFDPVRVVVRRERVIQTVDETNPERVRVQFDDEQDPVRVSGFTLTNPAEAEVEVSFTRPLQLTTTVTQQDDGSWRTYVEGDWPNLEIEQMETFVNPRPIRDREWPENIVVGGSLALGVAPEVDAVAGDVYLLYEFKDSFSVGPELGVNFVQDQARLMVGLQMQFHPWRQ